MFIVIGLVAAGALGLLSLRSMALAFGNSLTHAAVPVRTQQAHPRQRSMNYLRSSEAAMLITEILLSIGIAVAVVGLAAMAALPGRLLIGGILAQLAIIGALIAPMVTVRVREQRVRLAAVALGIAQLSNVIFFCRAITALA